MIEQFPQWRQENAASNYPFEDLATLQSDQEGFALTPELLLDAVLYPGSARGTLYLTSLELTNHTLRINIGDEDEELVCFTIVDLSDIDQFELGLVDSDGRDAGVLVTEPLRLAALTAWPTGVYRFDHDATPFIAACCLVPTSAGATALKVGTELLSHEVWLIGDDGVVLSVESPTVSRHIVRVDLVGDPLFRRKLCEPGLFQTPRFLRQIVFESGARSHTALPDVSGNIAITVDPRLAARNVLRIHATEGAVVFEAAGEQLQGIR